MEQEIRLRIGNDLHDGPLQYVVGGKMLAEAMLVRLERGEKVTPTDIQSIINFLDRSIQDTRQIIGDLRQSAELNQNDSWLTALNQWIATDRKILFPDSHSLIEVQLPDELAKIPDSWNEPLFRVCREAIQNALRHAKPNCIWVVGAIANQAIHDSIKDDGVGFDPKMSPHNHFGMKGMQERIEGMGGSFEHHSMHHAGTEIAFTIPLPTR